MIVGLLQQSDEGDITMAESHRMTAAQLADKLLQDEHADVLRDSVAWMARELMEAEISPRIGAEQALVAMVQEAYVNGVSTRKVDRVVEQLGLYHLSKDQVSRLCRGLDEQGRVFCERPVEGAYP